MSSRSKSALAIVLTALLLTSHLSFASADELPNNIAFRKISELRYNVSMNLLDQYQNQEVGIRIRRTTGSVSEIITLPSKVLGVEGKGSFVVNQKLEADDVFLFTLKNIVIFKVVLRDSTVIDLTNPEAPVPVIFESSTPQIFESTTALIDLPNNAVLRKGAKSGYVLTMNLLDRYAGREVAVYRERTVNGASQSLLLAKKTLGGFARATIVIKESFKAGDSIAIKSGNLVLYTYAVKANAT